MAFAPGYTLFMAFNGICIGILHAFISFWYPSPYIRKKALYGKIKALLSVILYLITYSPVCLSGMGFAIIAWSMPEQIYLFLAQRLL